MTLTAIVLQECEEEATQNGEKEDEEDDEEEEEEEKKDKKTAKKVSVGPIGTCANVLAALLLTPPLPLRAGRGSAACRSTAGRGAPPTLTPHTPTERRRKRKKRRKRRRTVVMVGVLPCEHDVTVND